MLCWHYFPLTFSTCDCVQSIKSWSIQRNKWIISLSRTFVCCVLSNDTFKFHNLTTNDTTITTMTKEFSRLIVHVTVLQLHVSTSNTIAKRSVAKQRHFCPALAFTRKTNKLKCKKSRLFFPYRWRAREATPMLCHFFVFFAKTQIFIQSISENTTAEVILQNTELSAAT